jgi:trans-2,3-dihydro-3-hydroxyanthranilate isomerase
VVRAEASARLRLRPLSLAAHRYTVLDVFAAGPLEGNALAVVHDADGLDEETMQRVARETRLSETTFVQSPTVEGADYRNRIWTMAEELPMAGHPSLGTAVAVAAARRESEASYVQQTGAGLQPVEVRAHGDLRAYASMVQEPADFAAEHDPGPALAAAGLDPGDAHPDLPAQVVACGLSHLLVPLRDAAALERVVARWAEVDELLWGAGAVTIYLAWPDAETGVARARALPRGIGAEDPATGSAAGPLCAYLAQRTGRAEWTVRQGEEMGRPSRLDTRMEGERPRVGGEVVTLVEGTIAL